MVQVLQTFHTVYPVELLAYFDVLGWNKIGTMGLKWRGLETSLRFGS